MLYHIPFFPYSQRDIDKRHYFHFAIDWQDKGFIAALQQDITPTVKLEKIAVPQDRLLVAIHVRTGSGSDKIYQGKTDEQRAKVKRKFDDQQHPLRFPPLSFYKDQLIRLSQMLGDQEMYVHIFTDNSQPQKIAEYFKRETEKPNIQYGYRQEQNKQNANTILEDFFGLTQFDYLIRPSSHFSVMASIIGHHKIIIHPTDYVWQDDVLVITNIETEIK